MKNATGSLAILGSGETSPNLVSVHRELLNGLDDSSDIFMIDSPFGFQEIRIIALKIAFAVMDFRVSGAPAGGGPVDASRVMSRY